MADEHKAPANLATAAMMDLISKGQALQASVIRGDGRVAQELIREQARATLEAYLDHTTEAARLVRAIATP